MTKELSPLEVSKQLKEFIFELELGNVDKLFVNGSFDIIETALKRLEKIDNEPIIPIPINRYNELDNKEEALKIIKEKNVNVRAFKKALLMKQDELSAYNSQNHRYEDDLTQEEFDLLKEVLL